jgi:hypothetical protein
LRRRRLGRLCRLPRLLLPLLPAPLHIPQRRLNGRRPLHRVVRLRRLVPGECPRGSVQCRQTWRVSGGNRLLMERGGERERASTHPPIHPSTHPPTPARPPASPNPPTLQHPRNRPPTQPPSCTHTRPHAPHREQIIPAPARRLLVHSAARLVGPARRHLRHPPLQLQLKLGGVQEGGVCCMLRGAGRRACSRRVPGAFRARSRRAGGSLTRSTW